MNSSRFSWLLLLLQIGSAFSGLPQKSLQEAQVLLEHWDDWAKSFRLSWSSSPAEAAVEGAPCAATANQSLAFLYFRRIRDSSAQFHTSDKKSAAQKEFFWLRHVAAHLRFYQLKMAGNLLPLSSRDSFCAPPAPEMTFPTAGKKLGFIWPPAPYYLLCDPHSSKCVTCSSPAINSSALLAEACHLKEPILDPLDTPSHPQRLFAKLKDALAPVNPKNFVRVEGGRCDARPEHTLWLTLLSELFDVAVKPREHPRTLREFKAEWRVIGKLDEDLAGFSRLFESAGRTVWGDRKYCDPHEGLVCGGASCKACVERRGWGDGGWSYEQGHLHEACKWLANNNKEIRRQPMGREQKKKAGSDDELFCPPVAPCPPTPNPPEKKKKCPPVEGHGGRRSGGSDPAGHHEYEIYRKTHQFQENGGKNGGADKFKIRGGYVTFVVIGLLL